jgi:segregation and condensation protein B
VIEEQAVIEKTELKVPTTLKALVEALIFAAQEPLSMNQIRSIYQGEGPRADESKHIEPEVIREIITDLNKEYTKQARPYRIVQIAGGYQFATVSEYADWLGRLYREQGRRKLSQSGIETLAIIAYKQPMTKAEVEKIRGVNCDYVLKNLLEKELLTVTGRAESVGRPLLYGTTREFLKHFGLNDITDLPRPREIEEILGESQFETERRMLEAQSGADQARKEQEEFKSRLPHIPKKKSELEEQDVEIVPHKKIREIKIAPAGERNPLEETGQEKIELTAEHSLMNVPPASTPVEENIQSEILSEALPLEYVDQEPLVQGISQQELAGDQEITDQDTSMPVLLEEPDGIPSTSQIPNGENEPLDLASEDIPHTQTRWKVWKEKIQGFIKKLFA